MINWVNAINIVIDLYNIILIFLITLFLIPKIKVNNSNLWFFLTNLILILFATADIFGWLTDGSSDEKDFLITQISQFVYFLLQPFLFISFLNYTQKYLQVNNKYKGFWITSFILLFVFIILLILTPIFDLYYYFTLENKYQRGPLLFVTVLIDFFYIVSGIVILIKNKKNISKTEYYSFLLFYCFPIVSELFQLLHYGVSLIITGFSLPIILIFLNLHNKLENSLAIVVNKSILKERELISIKNNTILALSNLVENRDKDVGNHILRIIKYVELLCNMCIKNDIYSDTIDEQYTQKLIEAVPMHDIGKIVIPDNILSKKGRLTKDETKIIQQHVTQGAKIVNEVLAYEKDLKLIKMSVNVANYHHEKWDGTGYPKELKGHDIPLSARIMSIADVFDALVTARVYKNKTQSLEDAFYVIEQNKNKNFDPVLVEQFLLLKNDIKKVVDEYGV